MTLCWGGGGAPLVWILSPRVGREPSTCLNGPPDWPTDCPRCYGSLCHPSHTCHAPTPTPITEWMSVWRTSDICSPAAKRHVLWAIQCPRVYHVWHKGGAMANFGVLLTNFFGPMCTPVAPLPPHPFSPISSARCVHALVAPYACCPAPWSPTRAPSTQRYAWPCVSCVPTGVVLALACVVAARS